MPAKRDFPKTKSHNVFGQARKPAKMFRAGPYARVSTNDQQTLSMQSRAMREYGARRGWTIAVNIREVGSGDSRQLQALRAKLNSACCNASCIADIPLLRHYNTPDCEGGTPKNCSHSRGRQSSRSLALLGLRNWDQA